MTRQPTAPPTAAPPTAPATPTGERPDRAFAESEAAAGVVSPTFVPFRPDPPPDLHRLSPAHQRQTLLSLQRTVGNATVQRLLAAAPPAAAPLQREPAVADPPVAGDRAPIDKALASGEPGDAKDIVNVNAATEAEKFKLIRILAYQGWVGPYDERKIEELWGSFGEKLVPLASREVTLFRHCLDVGAELDKLQPIKDLVTNFKSDVKAIVRGYLKANETTVLNEMANLGITEKADAVAPPATAAQNAALQETQVLAHLVSDLQDQRQTLRKIPVGWNQVIDREPGIPTVPIEMQINFHPTVQPNIGPKPGETSAKWTDVKKIHDDLNRQIADIANKAPAVYALIGQGGENPAAGAVNVSPEAARATLGKAMREVLDNIRKAGPNLASDDLDYRDLTPVHAQLYAGAAKGTSPTDWGATLPQSIAKDVVGDHEMKQALIKFGLGSLAAAAFLVAELATFGTATFFIAAAVGATAAGTDVALKADTYLDLAQAAKTNVSDKTTIAAKSQVDVAEVELVLAAAEAICALAGVATKAVGGIKAARALPTLPEGAHTKLSQPGGLTATEGKQVPSAKPRKDQKGTHGPWFGPKSHVLENHGPNAPEAQVQQRCLPKHQGGENIPQSTKFTDRAKMETAVGDTIDAKRPEIDAWLKTNPPANSNMPAIQHSPNLGNLGTGYRKVTNPAPGAPLVEPIPHDLPNIRVVLKADGQGSFVIQTAYPE